MIASFLNDPGLIIMTVGALVGISASLLGVFLVLRRTSMLTDAISHSILLGIVLMFFVVRDSGSPLLLVGAAATGILSVYLTELLASSKRVKEDAAIGLVFPAMFSLGVLLISLFARNVHIDAHAVLLGEIGFTWLDVIPLGAYLVPRPLLIIGMITLVNALFVGIFYKELKLVTFDASLAWALGFSPVLFHYALLSLTSVTAVGAFDAVGVVLFIAFVVVPPSAAYLLTDRLWRMILYSVIISILSSITGYHLAVWWDVSIGGMMASVTGMFLLTAFIFSPRYGLITQHLVRQRQGLANAQRMLLVHLYNHERRTSVAQENVVAALQTHLHWNTARAGRVLGTSLRDGLVTRDDQNDQLHLTERGRRLAQEVLEPWRHRPST